MRPTVSSAVVQCPSRRQLKLKLTRLPPLCRLPRLSFFAPRRDHPTAAYIHKFEDLYTNMNITNYTSTYPWTKNRMTNPHC